MPGPISSKQILSNDQVLEITNIDRFRPTLKCDLFIPSYIQSLSVATEFVWSYVLGKFPVDYFETTFISGKHMLDEFRRYNKGDYHTRENPAVALTYTLQYDFNDNNLDWNWLSTNKYLRTSAWQRSFFKCPKRGLYIGMDLEAMLINYNFKFRVNTRAEQLDLYNRLRKVFRLGCTETNDIDCDFHLDRKLMTKVAEEAGFAIDTDGQIVDPWNFTRFMNAHSQMPILYKLRLINQHYEWFLRMRNLPVHMDFQNALDVDDGQQNGMSTSDFGIEFQIAMRFPAPRTFAFYNEGNWVHTIHTEPNEGITVYSMKLFDIPEENYKGWPLYGHSNYMAEKDEEVVKCTVKKNDLLVCEGGDFGRAAIWPYDEPIRIQNHIHRLRAYYDVSVWYFYYLFYFYKNAGLISGKGIGIQGLSSKALHRIIVPLPPLAEQKRIVARLDELLPQIDRLK